MDGYYQGMGAILYWRSIVYLRYREVQSGDTAVLIYASGIHDSWERGMFGYFCGLHIVLIFV